MTATKPSGIAWIGEIPANWETNKLKYMFAVVNGSTPDTSNNDFWDGNIAWITPADMDEFGDIDGGERSITDKGYRACGTSLLPERSIVISTRAPIGKINCTTAPLCTNQGCKSLVHTGGVSRYFYYLLMCGQEELIMRGRGTTFIELGTTDLGNLEVSIPPLPEQQAIAAFLDDRCGQIDGIVADLERQVEILRQYKKALITETVTKGLDKTTPMKDSRIDWIGEMPRHWEMKRLKFLGSARNGLTYAPEDVVDEDKGTLVLRSSNIQNDRLAFDDNVYVSCRIPKEIVLQENDLLICSRNGSQALIGKSALIDEKTAGQTYGAFMCVYRSRYNKFIHYVFLSDIFSYYLGTFLTSTVNQLTNLNLYNIQIPIPMDFNEQAAIVDFLDHKCAEIDDLIAEKQKATETMQQYKKSLIYEYVTGKKRVAG